MRCFFIIESSGQQALFKSNSTEHDPPFFSCAHPTFQNASQRFMEESRDEFRTMEIRFRWIAKPIPVFLASISTKSATCTINAFSSDSWIDLLIFYVVKRTE